MKNKKLLNQLGRVLFVVLFLTVAYSMYNNDHSELVEQIESATIMDKFEKGRFDNAKIMNDVSIYEGCYTVTKSTFLFTKSVTGTECISNLKNDNEADVLVNRHILISAPIGEDYETEGSAKYKIEGHALVLVSVQGDKIFKENGFIVEDSNPNSIVIDGTTHFYSK